MRGHYFACDSPHVGCTAHDFTQHAAHKRMSNLHKPTTVLLRLCSPPKPMT